MARTSLVSVFEEFARYGPDIAIVQKRGYRRETQTYRQLANLAVPCALELKNRGIRTGDRVLLWGPNSAAWALAFWGCILRGAVLVPMDDAAAPEFAARVARDAAVKLIIASREKPPLDPAVPSLILEDLPSTVSHSHGHSFVYAPGEPKSPVSMTLADEPLNGDHMAEILFTSGTTAEPRGIALTYGNFLANLEPLERGIEPYRKWERWFHPLRFVTLVPLSHVFGQFMGLLVPPLLGATVVFEPSANPAEVIRAAKRDRATALIAVPRMLDALRNGLQREAESRGWHAWFTRTFASVEGQHFLRRAWRFRRIHRMFGWRFWAFISGGAALGVETEDFFRRLGYAVVQGYGMTETASLISLNHPFHPAQGSVGKILPGREFRVAGDGEILVRGGNVAAARLENGALRPLTEDGWVHTGDLGDVDAEGNLRIRGRKKNVIVTPAGLNIYPEDLEAALHKQAAVRDCVVLPLDRGGNAKPCAVLLLEAADGKVAEAARAAIDAANAGLAEYQRMREWVLWPEPDFPRTPTGKPRLGLIAARAAAWLGGEATEGPSWLDGLIAQISNSVPRFEARTSASPHPQQARSENLASSASPQFERALDLSSLDRVELMSALEERYQVELNEAAFAEAKTVPDVERLLSERLEASREPAARRAAYVYPRWAQREPVRWLRLAVYYALVWPVTQILAHPKIVGRELLGVGRSAVARNDLRGPVLVVANHVTRRADLGLILAALPWRLRNRLATAMAGETLQNLRDPPRQWFLLRRWTHQLGYWLLTLLFNVFPLPKQAGFRESFRFAGESVDRGYSVLVFPEGEVTKDGRMAAFRSGIGLLAENLNIPIVPMRMDGIWEMKREGRRVAHFGEITVRIGEPVEYPPGTPHETIARQLETTVKSL